MKRLIKIADYADSIILVVGNNVYEGMSFQTCIYKYEEQTGEVNKTSLVTKSKSDLLREISTYNNGQKVGQTERSNNQCQEEEIILEKQQTEGGRGDTEKSVTVQEK